MWGMQISDFPSGTAQCAITAGNADMRLAQSFQCADHHCVAAASTFTAWLAPFRKLEWVVYAKPPFGGPEAVSAYLSRYTHRVSISNNRLVSADAGTVAFRWKDYRIKTGDRQKVMTLTTDLVFSPGI